MPHGHGAPRRLSLLVEALSCVGGCWRAVRGAARVLAGGRRGRGGRRAARARRRARRARRRPRAPRAPRRARPRAPGPSRPARAARAPAPPGRRGPPRRASGRWGPRGSRRGPGRFGAISPSWRGAPPPRRLQRRRGRLGTRRRRRRWGACHEPPRASQYHRLEGCCWCPPISEGFGHRGGTISRHGFSRRLRHCHCLRCHYRCRSSPRRSTSRACACPRP